MLIKVSECEPLYYAYDVSKRLTIFLSYNSLFALLLFTFVHICNQLYKPGFNKLTPTPDTSVKVQQTHHIYMVNHAINPAH